MKVTWGEIRITWMKLAEISRDMDMFYKMMVAEYIKAVMGVDIIVLKTREDLEDFRNRMHDIMEEGMVLADSKMEPLNREYSEIVQTGINCRML